MTFLSKTPNTFHETDDHQKIGKTPKLHNPLRKKGTKTRPFLDGGGWEEGGGGCQHNNY